MGAEADAEELLSGLRSLEHASDELILLIEGMPAFIAQVVCYPVAVCPMFEFEEGIQHLGLDLLPSHLCVNAVESAVLATNCTEAAFA